MMTVHKDAGGVRRQLGRLVRRPIRKLGYDIVRASPARTRPFPTWVDRMRHARELGFQPRTILDAGAFHGKWSRTAAELFPGARLILVEPNPHVQEIIAANTAHIRPAPTVVQVALSDAPGTTTLHIWRDEKADVSASLLDHVAGPARLEVQVETMTLDDVVASVGASPDLVKLDLQGGELRALAGGRQVLRDAELMMIEFGLLDAYIDRATPRDLLDLMYDNGFVLYDIVDGHFRPYDGAMTGGDFLFTKKDGPLRAYKGWE